MKRDFTHTSTSTDGKLANSAWLSGEFSPYRAGEKYFTLVGSPEGLCRHRDEWRSRGWPDEHVIICERISRTAEALRQAARIVCPNVTIVKGDALEILRGLLSAGEKIGLVDFDGTDGVSEYHFALVRLMKEHDVRQGVIIASARGKCKDHLRYADQLALPIEWRNGYWGRDGQTQKMQWLPPTTKTVLTEYARRLGLSVKHVAYHGRGPMITFAWTM